MIITVGSYHGEAALTRESPYATLAYYGKGAFIPGKTYTIDGTDYMAISSTPSKYIPAVMLVKLKEI